MGAIRPRRSILSIAYGLGSDASVQCLILKMSKYTCKVSPKYEFFGGEQILRSCCSSN